VALNKSQLQKKAGIKGRQTIMNLLSQFEASGWLELSVGQWRKGRDATVYALNDCGMQTVAAFYPEFHLKREQTTEERREINLKALDIILGMFRQTMMWEKSHARNYEWALIITSDAQRKLSWRYKSRKLSRP
jgi:DNA-binding PadR family transcriptional regulator